jgi:outer membrane protein
MRLEKTLIRLGTVLYCLVTVSVLAVAQGEDATDSSQQKDTPAESSKEERLSWSLGGGFIASPRPYIDTTPQVIPLPVLTIRYKRFFVQGIRAGYEFVQTEKLTGSIFAQLQFQGLEPEESAFLEGMAERSKSMDGGLEVLYRGRPVGFRLAVLSDILGRSKGQEVSFMAITGAPLGKVLVLFGVGPRWLSQNRVDYYYGVRQEEARPFRPAYMGVATWNLDLNVTTMWDISSRWALFALLNRESLGSGIEASPIVERSSAYSLITALTYKF